MVIAVYFSDVAVAQSDGSQFTSFASFQLGKVTLAQVAKSIGHTKVIETGDAGEYVAKICYRTPNGIIYFLSGEMGGPDHELLGFGIGINDNKQPCAKYLENLVPKTLNLAGVQLGQTKKEFARIVETSVRWEKNTGRAYIESKRPMSSVEINRFPEDVKQSILAGSAQNYFDVGISIIGTFTNNKLSKIEVWKVETY
ncbi:MAG: hypothetical protein H7240_02460 [Glaciimonas sp.]|nr:hypothetical protein [Glaciimonas sp.]